MVITRHLCPDYCFESVEKISPNFLIESQIRGLILDIDNTLIGWDEESVPESVLDWVQKVKSAGLKIVLLSNGYRKKQLAVSDRIGARIIPSFLPKPFPSGFIQAVKDLDLPRANIAVIGDIVFTDILGANLLGLRSILVEPRSSKDFAGTRFWRFLEKIFRLRRPKLKT